MATYEEIKREVNEEIKREVKVSAGFVAKTCWIAHVLDLLGVKLRRAANRIDPEKRKHPCPPEKMPAIIAALRKLGRVQPLRTAGLTEAI